VTLNVRDIDVVAGLARVKEKGARNRIMILPDIVCATLQNYLEKRGNRQGSLFLTKKAKRISSRSLQDIFRSAADSCGIDKHLHSHLFRHTAGTHLNRVAGTTITQHVLGHSLRKNTNKYIHLNPDHYATYMKKHPFMNL
jgi:integrase/recombinase XerC